MTTTVKFGERAGNPPRLGGAKNVVFGIASETSEFSDIFRSGSWGNPHHIFTNVSLESSLMNNVEEISRFNEAAHNISKNICQRSHCRLSHTNAKTLTRRCVLIDFGRSCCVDLVVFVAEAWLDDHPDFAHDYFLRKATQGLVNAWLADRVMRIVAGERKITIGELKPPSPKFCKSAIIWP